MGQRPGAPSPEVPGRRSLLLGRCLLFLDHLDVEFSVAFDEEDALRRLVAPGRVFVSRRLEQVRAGREPNLGLPFRPVDQGAR